MKRALVVGLVLLPVVASADEVLLTGGGRLSGVIVARAPGSVTIDVGPGRVTLPMSRVVRIVSGKADIAVYRERAARLAPDNVTDWLALARWAEEKDLLTQARESYAYVLTLDPENAVAHRGLGHVWTGDRFATVEESYRARGYVQFEGAWVAPDERRAILEERAASAAAQRDRIEADARTREADARARVAEAEARRAEYAAQQSNGIPLDYAYGSYGSYGYAGYGGAYGGGFGGVYGGGVYGGFYDPFAPNVMIPPPLPTTTVIVNVPSSHPHGNHGPRPQPARGARASLIGTPSKNQP